MKFKTKISIKNRIIALLLVLVVILSLIPVNLITTLATSSNEVKFTVLDTTLNPIKDAKITLNQKDEYLTNNDGIILIDNLTETNDMQFLVSKVGYQDVVGNITLTTENEKTITLTELNTITVSGCVKDVLGNLLKDANIQISGYNSYSTKSDLQGNFSVSGVFVNNSYNLNVNLVGYKSFQQVLNISNDNVDLDINLQEKDVKEINFQYSNLEVKYGENKVNTAYNDCGVADSYESLDTSIATVDNDGKITPIGLGTTTIKAIKNETDDYKKSETTYQLTIIKGEQEYLLWTSSVPNDISWDNKFSNTVTGGTGDGEITYISNDNNIATVDNDGNVTMYKPGNVTITAKKSGGTLYNDKSISYELNIAKAKQKPLNFDEQYPNDIIYGDNSFVNKATGGSVDSKIEYSVDGNAATVDSNGKITTIKSGEVTVTAKLLANDLYEEVSNEYTLFIKKANQSKLFSFNRSGNQTIVYGDKFQNLASGGENSPITYKSSDTSIATVDNNGNITTYKSGDVVITAINPTDDRYNEKSISYNLTVNKAEQDVIFENGVTEIPTKVYGESYSNKANAKTTITYISSDESIATVNNNGKLEFHKAGTVVITANALETEQYNSATNSYTITIKKAPQVIMYDKGIYSEVYGNVVVETTFNDNNNEFINIAKSVQQGISVPVTYSIASGYEFIDNFDDETGSFTIVGAGKVVISSAIDSNEQYKTASSSYTLIINKAKQSIAFENSQYNIVSGHNFSLEDMPKAIINSNLFGTGEITYQYSDDTNGIVKSFDNGDIVLNYKKGSVKVIATKAGDNNYESATAEYIINVTPWIPETECYSVIGDKSSSDNEWFKGSVSLKSNDGYLLSLDNTFDNAIWLDSLDNIANTDGTNSISFYIKNSNGDISDLITKEISIDTVVPEATISTVAPSIKQKLLSIITFGLFGKDKVEYIIESSDLTSGVCKTEYFIDNSITSKKTFEELNSVNDWQEYNSSISIDKDTSYVVYVKVTDNAGNVVYTSTDGVIFDATKPVISVSPSVTDNKISSNYFIGDVKFDVSVNDLQPSSSISKIDYKIFVNEKEIISNNLYNYNEEDLIYNWSTSDLIVPAEGLIDTDSVKLTIIAEDLSDNISEQSYDFNVISEPAIVSTTVIEEGFYKESQQSVITVSGRSGSFKPENIKIYVSATDAKNNEIKDTYTISTWTKSGNNHIATITFNSNANYKDFYVEYKDAGEQGVSAYSQKMSFTIDKTKPTANVSINDKTWDKLLDFITFSLYKNSSVVVTANAQDDICTETPKIEYYKSNDTTIKTYEYLDNFDEWTDFESLTIEQDEIFTLYFKITDKAGNYSYISSNGYILDSLESVIEIIPESANKNGYYNKDVNVTINVEDINIYSGIQSVKYWVENNGIITQEDVLFTFDNKTPTYNELVNIKEFNITVDSKLNNSDNVILKVQVLDNAGNEKIESINMKIDTTKPTIKLSFDSNDANIIKNRGYFKINRKAYIEITERTSSFDELNATSIISIKAFNYLNEKIELNVEDMISDWVTVKGTTPDEDKHIAEILFSDDGNYDLTLLSYTDNAGNKNDDLDTCDSITPFTFTIDKTKPTAAISVNDNTWDKLLDFVTFGIYSKKIINISANANDDISPVRLEYCKLNDTTIKTTSDLDEIQDWKKYSDFNINQAECFVVYIKATDAAGNYTYISSDGAILDTNLPKITLTPEHTDITHNNIGVYNHDVKIKVDVSKDKPYSGIKTVEYWVIKDGIETQRETIFSFEKTAPIYAELVDTFNYDIIVDSEKNNSCDVNVYVGVTDNAGNYKEENIKIDIDTIAPVIHIDYDNNNYYQIKNDRGYFASTRTAKITIDERDGHFNLDDVVKSIKITANDINGKQIKDINTTEMISRYTDDSEHIVNISYIKEANYNLVPIVYQDLAENDAIIETGNSVSPYKFTVDINEPTATITVGELGTWNKIVEKLTFGLWSKDYVQVNCTVNDNISPIESISYYKTSDTTLKQVSDLEKLSNDNWIDFKPFDIKCNERFIIYLKVVDYAGNTNYISTNGVILDDIKPVVETVKPEITITPEQPINGIYSSDVKVSVKVVDNPIGIDNVYSGLKEVRYEIYNMGNKTQEGSLYKFDLTDPTQQDLCQIYEQENAIIVDKNLNNSNDVVIKVYAIDNAYNDNEASVGIKIDASAPIVKVDYDNNDGDITFANDKTDAYFNANRKATITISERNFDPAKVLINITNSDGAVPQLSSWSIVNGTGNGDDTLHIATLSYVNDGDYTFDIKCTDIAENNGVINYNNSIAPNKFTIDKTKPVVSISYDNNNSSNGNYYNASRNATITINEHNFEISRANVKLTAIDNGTNIGLPYVSNWSSNGDTHTAKISYTSDALYTFDFEYKDKAGNSISDIAQQSFYVDKTNPTLSISNIVDHSANNSSGNIGFKIITLDTNLDTFNPILTATIKNGNKFETKQIELGTFSDISNGKVYTVNNIDLDGIYRITCVATDKAGNSYSNVTLYNSDGSSYLQNSSSNDTLLTFSINRNGSTFEIDNNTTDLIKKYYVQKVKNDVVLVETNTDNLVSYEVTLNNKKLKENKDYTVSLSGGNGNWSKYTYSINKSLFEDEGEYTIVLSSVDKATNNAFSDIKDASVKFVVDRSAPVVAITGIGNNSRYRTNQQSVTLIPADDGGSLKSLIVALLDNEGNIIKEIIHLEEVDLQKTLEENDGKINFDIDEGLYQNVKVICTDYSVDDSNATNVYEAVFNNVSVSSNSFMIFWANKSLRYGTIIGITTLIFGLVTYIAIKKRKQQNTKNI